MTSQRLTIAATSLVLSASAVAPAIAAANPLLSGYGGPGEGNQAILGAGLVGGASGGGGSGSGASGLAQASGADAGQASGEGAAIGARGSGEASAGSARGTRGGAASASGSHGAGKRRLARAATAPRARPSARASTPPPAADNEGGSQTLGLSGADLLDVAIALVALLVIGLLTRRLAREPRLRREPG
jgi:hypothetical protein